MVLQRRLAIVTDSSCCLPKDLQETCGLFVVPHQLVIGGRASLDGVDIDPVRFYQMQRRGVTATTSGPSPNAFLQAFLKAGALCKQVLCLTLSPRFSATTFDSAQIAARMAKDESPSLDVRVMDTQAAAGAQGLMALGAARLAWQGASLDQTAARVEALMPKVQLLAFLDTLQYLGKSGKIPKVAAWAGSLLGFKPLTEMSQGEARLIAKPRSRAKAMEQMLQTACQRLNGKPAHVNIMHAAAPDDARELRLRAQASINCLEVFISEFTPVMGAHTGPGLLGLAFYTED
ncbi:MAG: DegV family protein [SAR202 cluster bacterium]|nr:DegV family protein [SAR202 cluster bacterium]